VLKVAGVSERCRVLTGSFFDHVPPGGDGYMLKTILHDWEDGQVEEILRGIRMVIPPHGRLLVIEALLAPGNRYDIGKLLDLNSFILAGGVDRSIEHYAQLFAAARFQMRRVMPTSNALTLIEAVPDLSTSNSARQRCI
jgi:hypothetical protein